MCHHLWNQIEYEPSLSFLSHMQHKCNTHTTHFHTWLLKWWMCCCVCSEESADSSPWTRSLVCRTTASWVSDSLAPSHTLSLFCCVRSFDVGSWQSVNIFSNGICHTSRLCSAPAREEPFFKIIHSLLVGTLNTIIVCYVSVIAFEVGMPCAHKWQHMIMLFLNVSVTFYLWLYY